MQARDHGPDQFKTCVKGVFEVKKTNKGNENDFQNVLEVRQAERRQVRYGLLAVLAVIATDHNSSVKIHVYGIAAIEPVLLGRDFLKAIGMEAVRRLREGEILTLSVIIFRG